MPDFVILTTKQAARLKTSLLKAIEVLGGMDVPALPKPRKARKAREPKAVPATSSVAQFQK